MFGTSHCVQASFGWKVRPLKQTVLADGPCLRRHFGLSVVWFFYHKNNQSCLSVFEAVSALHVSKHSTRITHALCLLYLGKGKYIYSSHLTPRTKGWGMVITLPLPCFYMGFSLSAHGRMIPRSGVPLRLSGLLPPARIANILVLVSTGSELNRLRCDVKVVRCTFLRASLFRG